MEDVSIADGSMIVCPIESSVSADMDESRRGERRSVVGVLDPLWQMIQLSSPVKQEG